jgi:hypothetical protein
MYPPSPPLPQDVELLNKWKALAVREGGYTRAHQDLEEAVLACNRCGRGGGGGRVR